jgi:hypothetical protein
MTKRESDKKRGGASAHEYGEFVSGGFDQKAIPGTNILQYNDPKGYNGSMTGGKKQKKDKKTEGGSLTTVAVPAVLLVANQLYKRKGNRSAKSVGGRGRGTRKNKKSLKRR